MTDLQALRVELDAGHPDTGAYSVDDATAAVEINVVNRTLDRSNVPAAEILAAVVPGHYLTVFGAAGDETHRRYWEDMMNAGGTVDLDHANIRTALTTIFAGQTETLTALSALQTQAVSRAAELGLGNVRAGTVAQARSL